MIIFFGPAGAGKSVQGQILAARHGWRWLSTGQLLRDSHDQSILKQITGGNLADTDKVNAIMAEALKQSNDIDHLVVDGFPREPSQAKWLVDILPKHKRSIKMIVVLDVPQDELLRRLKLRGRRDDTAEGIDRRLEIYKARVRPILDYFAKQDIPIVHIDGIGTVGAVHDRIESELEACSLV